MDGVLTDSEPLINAAAVAMFKEKGLTVQPEDFLPFVGTGENRYLGGVAGKYNFPFDLEADKKRTYEIYLELVPTQLRAFPGAQNLVHECRKAGLKIAVASSADRIKIEANLKKIGLPPAIWDSIVTGEDVVHKKPAPDIFLAAADKLHLTRSQCTVVEDAVNGVEAAKAAGMRCVAVAQSFASDRLQAADLIRDTIGEVTLRDLTGNDKLDAIKSGSPEPAPSTPPASTPAESPVVGNTAATEPATGPGQPWGLLATLGFSLLVALAFIAAQFTVGMGFVVGLIQSNQSHLMDRLQSNGLYWAVATCASSPLALALTWLFVRLRRGISAREYLALRAVPRRQLFRWCLLMLGLVALSDAATSLMDRSIVPDIMVEVYRTSYFAPLLWLALIVAAPLAEETFFRGFIFAGIERSPLGGLGAVVLTSLAWAAIHLQYDGYGIGTVFVIGLFLGYVRFRTRSLYPCLVLHAFMNLIAAVQAMALVKFIGPGA